MKRVTAYQDSKGNLHKTRESVAMVELQCILGNTIQLADIKGIISKRSKIISLLMDIDTCEDQNETYTTDVMSIDETIRRANKDAT